MQLILGSQSPRRLEILNYFKLNFKQVSPQFDEDAHPFNGDPKTYAQMLAKGKADSLVLQFPSSIILTADTIVYKDGKIYGKPRDEKEAFEFLKDLSGSWHSVFTALTTVTPQKNYFHAIEETRVMFHTLTESQMQAYHRIHAFADKAGGYMIQGSGSVIVQRIEGCYYNVMGLPINGLYRVLLPAGIDLWKHLKG